MNIILMGSSKILYSCAEIIKQFYGEQLSHKIVIFDTNYSSMYRRFQSVFDVFLGQKAEMMQKLEQIDSDTIVLSINNQYLIPQSVIDNRNLTLINLHHALLPSHPGRNAEAWTIFDGDEYGGITWHYINSGIDTGDIIKQASVKITEDMRSLDLLQECNKLITDSLLLLLPFEKIQDLPVHNQFDHEMDAANHRKIHYSNQAPGNGYLDPTWPVEKISRFLRCMDYGAKYPLGKPHLLINGNDWIIKKYSIIREPSNNDTVQTFSFDKELLRATFFYHDITIILDVAEGKEKE